MDKLAELIEKWRKQRAEGSMSWDCANELEALLPSLDRAVAQARVDERNRVNKIWREATTRVLNNPVLSIELNSFVENIWLRERDLAAIASAKEPVK